MSSLSTPHLWLALSLGLVGCGGSGPPPDGTIDGGSVDDGSVDDDPVDGGSDPDGGGPREPTPPEALVDGRRLEAYRVVVEGGPDVFLGWYDTALATDCEPEVATDAQLRCLPVTSVTGTLYADAACSDPIYVTDTGCDAPYHRTLEAYGEADVGRGAALCVPRLAVHRLTAVDPVELYMRTATGCEARDKENDEAYYRSETVVAPESFVAIQLNAQDDDRVVAIRADAAEGARAVVSVLDTTFDDFCVETDDLPGICTPASTAAYSPLGSTSPACAPADFTIIGSTASCLNAPRALYDERSVTFYSVAETTSAPLYLEAGNACTLVDAVEPQPDGARWIGARAGATVAGARMSVLTFGTGRFRSRWWADEHQTRALAAVRVPIRDEARETTCSPTQTSDGRYLCIPDRNVQNLTRNRLTDVYADEACTQRAVFALEGTLFIDAPDQCGARRIEAVYEVGELAPPALYSMQLRLTGWECWPSLTTGAFRTLRRVDDQFTIDVHEPAK